MCISPSAGLQHVEYHLVEGSLQMNVAIRVWIWTESWVVCDGGRSRTISGAEGTVAQANIDDPTVELKSRSLRPSCTLGLPLKEVCSNSHLV